MAGQKFYPQMEPASPGSIARAHALNRAHPNLTFFTPAQQAYANRQYRRNNPLGLLGDHLENFLQLREVGQQLTNSFDPRTKGGIANIAALFAGGPEGEEFAGEDMGGFNVPPKSADDVFQSHAQRPDIQRSIQDFLRGHAAFKVHSEDGSGSLAIGSMGRNRLQDTIHRALGNAHEGAGIPHEFPFEHLPNFHEGPRGYGFHHEPDASLPSKYHEFVKNKLAQSERHFDNFAAPHYAAEERAAAGAEHHFFSGKVHPFTELHEYGPRSQPEFNEHIRDAIHSDRKVAGLSRKNLMNPAQRGAREAALRRILAAHNHMLN